MEKKTIINGSENSRLKRLVNELYELKNELKKHQNSNDNLINQTRKRLICIQQKPIIRNQRIEICELIKQIEEIDQTEIFHKSSFNHFIKSSNNLSSICSGIHKSYIHQYPNKLALNKTSLDLNYLSAFKAYYPSEFAEFYREILYFQSKLVDNALIKKKIQEKQKYHSSILRTLDRSIKEFIKSQNQYLLNLRIEQKRLEEEKNNLESNPHQIEECFAPDFEQLLNLKIQAESLKGNFQKKVKEEISTEDLNTLSEKNPELVKSYQASEVRIRHFRSLELQLKGALMNADILQHESKEFRLKAGTNPLQVQEATLEGMKQLFFIASTSEDFIPDLVLLTMYVGKFEETLKDLYKRSSHYDKSICICQFRKLAQFLYKSGNLEDFKRIFKDTNIEKEFSLNDIFLKDSFTFTNQFFILPLLPNIQLKDALPKTIAIHLSAYEAEMIHKITINECVTYAKCKFDIINKGIEFPNIKKMSMHVDSFSVYIRNRILKSTDNQSTQKECERWLSVSHEALLLNSFTIPFIINSVFRHPQIMKLTNSFNGKLGDYWKENDFFTDPKERWKNYQTFLSKAGECAIPYLKPLTANLEQIFTNTCKKENRYCLDHFRNYYNTSGVLCGNSGKGMRFLVSQFLLDEIDQITNSSV